ncbi:Uncharacterised protein [Serratia fonticola]|uniref:hypothetical protein n=1 Tax=Serratia fonticola TaxID=47917 RepID=UPI0021776587|nr:hypothetical protein [Serratia fonticola]CAI1875547.1 Uncharacterised protein [Serratia fonticola]
MNAENKKNLAKAAIEFFEKNKEIFLPDEEVSKIIELVRTEKDEDLLRMQIVLELVTYSNKVAAWNKSLQN